MKYALRGLRVVARERVAGRTSGSSTRRRSPPVVTSSTTTEPRWPASAVGRELLRLRVSVSTTLPRVSSPLKKSLEVVDRDVEVAADELVVVLRFDAGVAEVHRLVADDVREQRAVSGG